jgi:hypothetical protein
MEYSDKIFMEQFPIVKEFLYHLTCYRELYRTYKDLNLKSEFWTHTIDAHLLQACILWCMVFGAHGNPTHWKNLCEQDREKLENSFREGLFKNTGLTQEKWDIYWKEMNDFRGGYAAHRELNYSKPVPSFSTAEEVAYYYDTWIREIIKPDIFDEPPLQKSVSSIQKEIRPLVMHYLSQTKLVKEDTELVISAER